MFDKMFNKNVQEQAIHFMAKKVLAESLVEKYLRVWFEQSFLQPQWQVIFGDNNCSLALAYSVTCYFFDPEMKYFPEKTSKKFKDQIKQVEPHVQKWADDVMESDREREVAELILQSILMEGFFLENNSKMEQSLKEKRMSQIKNILQRYENVNFRKNIAPKDYDKTIMKFIKWEKKIVTKLALMGHEDWLVLDYEIK